MQVTDLDDDDLLRPNWQMRFSLSCFVDSDIVSKRIAPTDDSPARASCMRLDLCQLTVAFRHCYFWSTWLFLASVDGLDDCQCRVLGVDLACFSAQNSSVTASNFSVPQTLTTATYHVWMYESQAPIGRGFVGVLTPTAGHGRAGGWSRNTRRPSCSLRGIRISLPENLISLPPPPLKNGTWDILYSVLSVHGWVCDWVCAFRKPCKHHISKTSKGNFTQFWSHIFWLHRCAD